MCDVNPYKDWNLNNLKEELRKRNARVTGRKAELVDRLLYLDSVGKRREEPEPGKHCVRLISTFSAQRE